MVKTRAQKLQEQIEAYETLTGIKRDNICSHLAHDQSHPIDLWRSWGWVDYIEELKKEIEEIKEEIEELTEERDDIAERNETLEEEKKQLTKDLWTSEHHRATWQRQANIEHESYLEMGETCEREVGIEHERYLETQFQFSEKLWEVCQELDIENHDKSENIIKEIKKFKEENKELRLWVERNQEEIDRLREVIDGE